MSFPYSFPFAFDTEHYTTTVSSDLLLIHANTQSVAADIITVNRLTASITADLLISTSYTISVTADLLLRKTKTATVTADILLRASRTTQLTADSLLRGGATTSVTADLFLRGAKTATVSADVTIGFTAATVLADLILIYLPWHRIYDATYSTMAYPTNRVYLIGQDEDELPLYGNAEGTTQIGLVGERLRFVLEQAISSQSDVDDVVSALLEKSRLLASSGQLRTPPNAATELWDVIKIWEPQSAQEDKAYRVTGIRFDYAARGGRITHTLSLCPV